MPRRRLDITDEMVIDLYFNKDLNRKQTAKKLNCSEDLILYRLKKLGLKPKDMADCVFAGRKRNVIISSGLSNIIDGEMLGDGSLFKYYKQADFRESFGYDKKEWAKYLIDLFLSNNIPIMGRGLYKRNPSGKSLNCTWSFSTLNNMEFAEIHKKWYIINDKFNPTKPRDFGNRKYIKMVPVSLVLTPECLLHWYIGDGSTSGYGCFFYTQGFNRKEVEFLRFSLNKVGIKSACYNNIIGVPKKERIKLLEIIGDCPVDCYKYKWKLHSTKCQNAIINDHIDMNMVESYIKYRESLKEEG